MRLQPTARQIITVLPNTRKEQFSRHVECGGRRTIHDTEEVYNALIALTLMFGVNQVEKNNKIVVNT
jgi:hypothetical protein